MRRIKEARLRRNRRSDQNKRRSSVARATLGIIAAAALMILGTNTATAVVNGTEPDPTDTRFDAVAAFGRTENLSGTGQQHNTFGNGTLIAPNLVISAKHLLPTNTGYHNLPDPGEYTFRFRRRCDGSLGSIAQGWESFHQVTVQEFILFEYGEYQDLMLCVLSSPVTHIVPMQIATHGKIMSLIPGTDEITIAGWGREDTTVAIGGPRGRLLYAQPPLTGVNCSNISFKLFEEPSNPCACGANVHDSGGALLIGGESGEPFQLAGVISGRGYAVLTTPITSPQNAPAPSYDTRHDAVAAVGPTSWLTEELQGEPDDGDNFEHFYTANAVLISPTQLLLQTNFPTRIHPDGQIYYINNLPPPGAYTARFRRNTDGSLGSFSNGWQSFHQVAIESYTLTVQEGFSARFVIATLAEPVAHITPMRIAETHRVNSLTTSRPIHVSGWAWGNEEPVGHLARIDNMYAKSCGTLTLETFNLPVTERCGAEAYSNGAAFAIERSARRYAILEELGSPAGITAGSGSFAEQPIQPVEPEPVPYFYADPDDPRFSVTPFPGATPVLVKWFELVALSFEVGTIGQLLIGSVHFDQCHIHDCARPPRPPIMGCADVNGDGIIDEKDQDTILAAYGPCQDCENCPEDLDGDCFVDETDIRIWGQQFDAGLCPCLADFNLDGVVDALDVQYVIDNFGPCDCTEISCPADLNDDRVVDFLDLMLILDLPDWICRY